MKTILFFIALLLGLESFAQDYYVGDYAKGTNVTFKCTTMYINMRVISNVKNKYILTPQLLRNGDKACPDPYKQIRSNDPDNKIILDILRAAFTSAEVDQLKRANAWFSCDVIVAPTGEVIEVGFMFPEKSLFMSIKPDTYYQIEQEIKSRIRYTMDDKTRDLYPWILDGLIVNCNEL